MCLYWLELLNGDFNNSDNTNFAFLCRPKKTQESRLPLCILPQIIVKNVKHCLVKRFDLPELRQQTRDGL